jgi:hypothetical protein
VQAAWNEIHAAVPAGWFVGRPTFEPRELVAWSQHAFDTTERPNVDRRSREWTAVGETEVACLREMARCLREISEGRMEKDVR